MMLEILIVLGLLFLGVIGLYVDTQIRLRRRIEQLTEPIGPIDTPPVRDPGPPDRYVTGWDDAIESSSPATLPDRWAEEQALKGRRVDKDTLQLQHKLWQEFEAD